MLSSRITNRLHELKNLEWHDEFLLVAKVPAVLIIDGLDGTKRSSLAVVWYDSERQGQFEFHLTISLKTFEEAFATHPEMGAVDFLGQVKEWPKAEEREQIVKELRLHSEESRIIHWMVPIGGGGTDGNGMPLPISCMCEVILVGHPNFGLLVPEKYYSEETRRKVMAEFHKLIGWPPQMPEAFLRHCTFK